MINRGRSLSRFPTTIAIRTFAVASNLALVCPLAGNSLRGQSLDTEFATPDVKLGAFVVMAHAAYARLQPEDQGKDLDAFQLAKRVLDVDDPHGEKAVARKYLADHDPNGRQQGYEFQFDLVPPEKHPELAELGLGDFYGLDSPHAFLFKRNQFNPTRNQSNPPIYILAFRGTDIPADKHDWVPDLFGAIGAIPNHYLKSETLVTGLKKSEQFVAGLKTIVERDGGILLLTGHSLGGGIAEYVAQRQGLIAVTFNSAHLSQPFEGLPHGLVLTYHIVGKNQFWRLIHSDIINAARLGGNFEQTRVVRVPISTAFPFGAHTITRFYEWGVEISDDYWEDNLSQGLNPKANDALKDKKFHRSEILDSTPDLVAELPTILRQAIRRNDINLCPAFSDANAPAAQLIDQLSDAWDLRFRVGYVRDSYPAGGLPIENLRVLDPPSGGPAPADSAFSWDGQLSFSHPMGNKSATLFNVGHRSLSYEKAVSHDFSITRTSLGWMRVLSAQNLLTLSADYSHFKSVNGNTGQVLEAEAAYSHEFSERKVLWLDTSVGSIRRAGLAGGNGTMFDSSAGFRWPLEFLFRNQPKAGSVFAQARTFAGHRTADEARFADTQWGGGVGLTWKGKNFRAFLEPSARWTRHHLADPAATKLFDRETVLRAEIACDINSTLGRYRFLGTRITLGYSWIRSDTATATGSYSRRLLGLQVSKSY